MKVKTRFKRMDIFERAAAFLRPRLDRQLLVLLLRLALLIAAWPQNPSARQNEQDPAHASQGQKERAIWKGQAQLVKIGGQQ
jgi:hypothetical protein